VTRSGWSDPFGEPFQKALRESSSDGSLDIGAVAEDGAFEVHYDSGKPEVTTSEPHAGLMFFLTRLYTRLQQLGTVGAVDLSAYAQPLQSD
jgi:hypothetical protein